MWVTMPSVPFFRHLKGVTMLSSQYIFWQLLILAESLQAVAKRHLPGTTNMFSWE